MLSGLTYLFAAFLGVILAVVIVGVVSIFVHLIDRQIPTFFTLIWLGLRSFFNRKELSVFEDYVCKLNEFGVGKFEWKRFGRKVTILLDGAPVAVYSHYDNKISFPVLEDYYWVSDEKPSDGEFMGAILVGCLASPLYAKLKGQEDGSLLGGFYYFISSQGEKKVVFQIFSLNKRSDLNYAFLLPPVDMSTDPERYFVSVSLSYNPKVETALPYKVLAQHGFPKQQRALLYL
jgi:hypothetical protein